MRLPLTRTRLTPGMIAVILMAFFALAAGVVINRTVFERLPHLEDEFGYLYQAKIFAGGHAYAVRDPEDPVAQFWQPFVIQPETQSDGVLKRFGKYTPGWPLLLTFGVLLGTPWLINPMLAMLSVALVYRLGREIFQESVGVVSAALLAISPMALLLDATLMSHVPAMFMAIVFVYGYWRMTRAGKGRYRWAVLSGLALGLMLSTRPLSAAAIAVPVVLHALAQLIDTFFAQDEQKHLWEYLRKDDARLRIAYGTIFFIATFSIVLGLLTALGNLPNFRDLTIGWGSVALGVAYTAIGLFALRRSKLALAMAVLLWIADSLLTFQVNQNPFTLALRALLLLLMLQGLGVPTGEPSDKLPLQKFAKVFSPLLVLAVFVLPTGLLWPVFNQIWTGDWKINTFTLLWAYDIPGFGEGHGLMAGGHTVDFGFRNARTDMGVYFRDLFGFTMDPAIDEYLSRNV